MQATKEELEKKATSVVMLAFLLVSVCSFTLSIPCANTEPTTITVPGDYPTIQGAINAANLGDTILVAAGTYVENVIVNKTVTLIGEDSFTTIIDGDRNGTVVEVIANNVSISGFTIENSTSEETYSGIIINANSGNISSNIITNNLYGIRLSNSSGILLSHNNVTNNKYGVSISDSSNNILLGNRMFSNQYNLIIWGSTLSHYIHNIDNSNLVESKPTYYWINQHGVTIPSDGGYVALINSTEVTVKNLTLTNNGVGIQLAYTKNSSITNNNLTNTLYGFHLFRSSDNVISYNTATNNQYGIALINSTEVTVKNLTLTNNGVGIQLAYTKNSSITNNNLASNVFGFDLFHSDENVLSNNTSTNNQYGIAMDHSSYNLLSNNNVTGNQCGVKLVYSLNNTIYHNIFTNANQTSVAESTNIWDDGYPSAGNYWSDYTGVDSKKGPNQDQFGSDGMGDTPYFIGLDQDRYPLMEPVAVHDISIKNILPYKTVVGQGYKQYIDVEVTNKGNRMETFNVTVYVNATFVGTQTVNSLTIGELFIITFTWNTSGFAKGNYEITAYASDILFETNTTDNNFTYNAITVTIAGDVNGDRKISISDIVTIASAYGTRIGEWLFKPNADIDSDKRISIYDITIAASRYGYAEP